MKNNLLTILTLLLMSIPVSAQKHSNDSIMKNEIYLSVGSFLGANFSNPNSINSDKYSPALSLGYTRRINRTWAFGVTFTHVYNKETCYDFPMGVEDYTKPTFYNHRYFTLMATAKVSWAKHKNWNLYTRAAAGPSLTVQSGTYNHNDIVWYGVLQFSPIGFEAGNDRIRGFLDLGFGIQGIFNAGVAYRF